MTSSPAPTFPSADDVALPGRVLARSGVSSEISGAALELGEMAITSDDWRFWIGDESQSPPWIPTSKFQGNIDWTLLNPTFNNINLSTINNKTLQDLLLGYITTGPTPVITIINDNLTKTVYSAGADFADLEAAYAWLSQRTISTLGSVTLIFPVGRIVETKSYTISHPNGDRIYWVGAALKTPIPTYTNFQVTGNTAAKQATDSTNNLALLRNSFSTEIYFTNGGHIVFTNPVAAIANILFSSDGALGGASFVDGLTVQGNGAVTFQNCAVTGFDFRGLLVQNGASVNISYGTTFVSFNNGIGIAVAISSTFGFTSSSVISISNGGRHINDYQSAGLSVSDGALAASYPYYSNNVPALLFAAGNAGQGVICISATLSGTFSLISRLNSVAGLNAAYGSSIRLSLPAIVSDNSGVGVQADTFSLISMQGSTVTNNATIGIACYNDSFVFQSGSNVSGNSVNYSPAVGTTGNTNALIA